MDRFLRPSTAVFALMFLAQASPIFAQDSTQGQAADSSSIPSPREIPVGERADHAQEVMSRVNGLVTQLSDLSSNLKEGMTDEDLKATVGKIDMTINNASKLLAPGNGISQTEERITAKLQDAMDQLKDIMDRIQQGQGSAGIFLKDPELAEELKKVGAKLARLSGHRHEFRFVLDIGLQEIKGYSEGTSRVYFNLGIWPTDDHYYLFGFADDPRGKITILHTTVTSPTGVATSTDTSRSDETGLVFTGMIGKVFFNNRLDLSLGCLYGDLAFSAAANIGPLEYEDRLKFRVDVYSHAIGFPMNERFTAIARPWKVVYASVGLDGIYRVGGTLPWAYGAGITFDDTFVRYLFNTYLSNAI